MKLKISHILLILPICLSTTYIHADKNVWIDKQGKVIENNTWRQSKNNFGAMLMPISDMKAFEKAWYRPASPDYTPNLPITTKAKVGQTINMVIMFGGCTADKSGNCILKGNVKITNPDGKVLTNQAIDLFQSKKPPAKMTSVSTTVISFKIDSSETLGKYRFDYVVTDTVANTTLNLSRNILFTK